MTACSKPPQSDIGLVDVPRITSNWPKFLNYQNQLNADTHSIERRRDPNSREERESAALRPVRGTDRTHQRRARCARQVATDKHLTYVFTRQFVGYGGVDITPEVEKILQIVEKATPSP